MHLSHFYRVTSICIAVAVLAALVGVTAPAQAAPPYAVTYRGASVTTAVPGKPVTVNYQVTNTGTTEYSGVKVIFHVPNGLSHTNVSPANAEIIDDKIMWVNVPIAAGKTFNPSITYVMDAGTPLKTKRSVWVEVTGDDMEANSQNFSLTAVAKQPMSSTTSGDSIVPKINATHRAAYGRNPTASEHAYWWDRVVSGAKTSVSTLLGAMQFHNLNGIAH